MTGFSNDYQSGFADGVAKASLVYKDWANRLRKSAQKTRKDGTFKYGWPFGNKTFVAPNFERTAKQLEDFADNLDKIRTEVAEQMTPEWKLPEGVE